ncbi:calcium/sodium antiporter [Patescibacteria group bacterium]|nr:calcium/sodium antiporter [Patescibacteria group bacterium]
MLLTLSLFVLGFILIIKGADLLVDGSSALAKKLRVSSLVIGLTIVSFGTSLPEMLVNLFASAQGATDLAIANVLGSNIANILLILGVAAIIYPLAVSKGTVWREIPFSLLAVIMLAVLANDALLSGTNTSMISRSDGLVLIAFLVIFLYYIYNVAKNDRKKKMPDMDGVMKVSKSLLYLFIGIIGLIVGGNWVVDGAIEIASFFNISESLIGLTIIALGTSLPELVTSAVAAYKHNAELAVGNAVGSNIFNIFWILGLSAVIRPLPFNISSNYDILMVVGATLLLFIWMFIGKKHILQRWQGLVFILMYICYIGFVVYRG